MGIGMCVDVYGHARFAMPKHFGNDVGVNFLVKEVGGEAVS